jgi:hypothetical protein
MKKDLNAFETFLVGKKTYLTALAGIVWGVIRALQVHHWQNMATWIYSGASIASFRAAWAELQAILAPVQPVRVVLPTPPVAPVVSPSTTVVTA